MKKLREYIFEHFVNLFYDNENDVKNMIHYSKEVYDMIQVSYAYTGGLIGAETYEQFCENYIYNTGKKIFWKCVRRNDVITAVRIYDLKNGRKGIVCATNNTEQGKTDLAKLLEEDYSIVERDVWAENSGKALSNALKHGAAPFTANIAMELMPTKDIVPLEDGYFYERNIHGVKCIKCLVGVPKHQSDKPSQELVSKLKSLAMKYSFK